MNLIFFVINIMKNDKESLEDNKEKSKEIYFTILFYTKTKITEEIKFENHENIDCIFSNEEKIEEWYESKFKYKKVFKQSIKNDKNRKNIFIKFKAQEKEYSIDFYIKAQNLFVFDLNLLVYGGLFFMNHEKIKQSHFFDKIKIIIKYLEQNNE